MWCRPTHLRQEEQRELTMKMSLRLLTGLQDFQPGSLLAEAEAWEMHTESKRISAMDLFSCTESKRSLPAALIRRSKGRSACRLCGTTTNFYCTGCKNYLCCGSQAINDSRIPKITRKLQQEAIDTDPVKDPAKTIKIPFFDSQTKEWKQIYAFNSCYLVQHKTAFNIKEWAM